eukprot:387861_1
MDKKFEIGDIISVYVRETWCTATVVELDTINDTDAVKIDLDIGNPKNNAQKSLKDELKNNTQIWLPLPYTKFDRNLDTEINFMALKTLFDIQAPCETPIYCNKKLFFLTQQHFLFSAVKLFCCDLANYEMKEISYPDNFLPQICTQMAIDSIHGDLYILSIETIYDEELTTILKSIGIYNIFNEKWTIQKLDKTIEIAQTTFRDAYSVYVNDEMYILNTGMITSGFGMKYSKNENQIADINMNALEDVGVRCATLWYDKQRETFMAFGGFYYDYTGHTEDDVMKCHMVYLEQIWCYQTCGNDQWIKYDAKLPLKASKECKFEVICGFDSIVFVLYFGKEGLNKQPIWCLDLNGKKWFKSHVCLPSVISTCSWIVKTDDNYIHLFGCKGKRLATSHIRISLFDIIPYDLFDWYSTIVTGYIKMIFSMEIPTNLQQLISCYYSEIETF